jgi:hypothetical protein
MNLQSTLAALYLAFAGAAHAEGLILHWASPAPCTEPGEPTGHATPLPKTVVLAEPQCLSMPEPPTGQGLRIVPRTPRPADDFENFSLQSRTVRADQVRDKSLFDLTWGLTRGLTPAQALMQAMVHFNGAISASLYPQLTAHARFGSPLWHYPFRPSAMWALAVEHEDVFGFDLLVETFRMAPKDVPWTQLGVRRTTLADRLRFKGTFGQQPTPQRPKRVHVAIELSL